MTFLAALLAWISGFAICASVYEDKPGLQWPAGFLAIGGIVLSLIVLVSLVLEARL